jgi:hypothetical protein
MSVRQWLCSSEGLWIKIYQLTHARSARNALLGARLLLVVSGRRLGANVAQEPLGNGFLVFFRLRICA